MPNSLIYGQVPCLSIEVAPSDRSGKANTILGKDATATGDEETSSTGKKQKQKPQNLGAQCPQLHKGLSVSFYSNLYNPISSQPMPSL